MVKIVSHHDADGVASAALYALYLAKDKVEASFPEEFGEDEGADVMLDMKPKNFGWLNPSRELYDHHPGYPQLPGTFRVFWDTVPTSLIVYRRIRSLNPQAPADYRVSVGLVGDGQPELIPLEVWERYPELMEEFGGASMSYGEVKIWTKPAYFWISAGINALCRMRREKEALELLLKLDSPLQLLLDENLNDAREKVRAERERIIRSAQIFRFRRVTLVAYTSAFRMEGQIASELESETRTVVVALNQATRKFSIRGAYAEIAARKIRQFGMQADGHLGFMGGSLGDKNLETLVRALEDV